MSIQTQPTLDTSHTPLLDDEGMRAAGFTDRRAGFWFYSRMLDDAVSFTITINKGTGIWTEDILDEDYLQPYHYGRYGQAEYFRAAVDKQVQHLNSLGFTVAIDHRLYGCAAV